MDTEKHNVQVPDGNKCGRKLVDKELTGEIESNKLCGRSLVDSIFTMDPGIREDGQHTIQSTHLYYHAVLSTMYISTGEITMFS